MLLRELLEPDATALAAVLPPRPACWMLSCAGRWCWWWWLNTDGVGGRGALRAPTGERRASTGIPAAVDDVDVEGAGVEMVKGAKPGDDDEDDDDDCNNTASREALLEPRGVVVTGVLVPVAAAASAAAVVVGAPDGPSPALVAELSICETLVEVAADVLTAPFVFAPLP